MKNSYLFLLILGTLAGCTKDIKTFDGEPVVYFQHAIERRHPYENLFYDSSLVSFAYMPGSRQDSLLPLCIKVSGAPDEADRSYTLRVNDSSTAVEGTHYAFVNSDYTIRAGEVTDTVYIRLKRLPVMLSASFTIYLELHANEHFGVDIEKKVLSASAAVSSIRHRVKFDDVLARPKYWLDAYLGTFTRKKYYLMCAMLEIPLDKMNTSVTIPETVYYGKFMQRYFNEQKANGTPILEEDGTEMIMGPASQ